MQPLFFILTENMIRLVGGNKPSEGRIEVKWNNRWGTVCDDYFDDKDGDVICKYLGYPGVREIYPRRRRFGRGSGPIWLDNMFCGGYEASPFHCSKNPIGKHDCRHYEDTGIECNGMCQSCKSNYIKVNNRHQSATT